MTNANEMLEAGGVMVEVQKTDATVTAEGREVMLDYGIPMAPGQTDLSLVRSITLTGIEPIGPIVLTVVLPQIEALLREHGQEMQVVGQGGRQGH